jgi:hypothetical protein
VYANIAVGTSVVTGRQFESARGLCKRPHGPVGYENKALALLADGSLGCELASKPS